MRAFDAIAHARAAGRDRLHTIADVLAAAVVASLPWSTSATAILIVVWLIALLPTFDSAAIRRELTIPAGGLPVALCALAALGLLWAESNWAARLEGLGPYLKLLVIPLLLAQFRRSDRGWDVLATYLASVLVLLALSWTLRIWPQLSWREPYPVTGVPFKDYIAQSTEFAIVAFALLILAGESASAGRRGLAALAVALALTFFANLTFVVPSRTILVVIPVLLVVLSVSRTGWKGGLAVLVAGTLLAGIAWSTSPIIRDRVFAVGTDIEEYRAGQVVTSSGLRLAFWKRSIALIQQAPVLGLGTEGFTETFRRTATGSSGPESIVTGNPHNQIFSVAIQLGLVGTGLLFAMWIAHLLLFRGGGPAGLIGLVVVVQNIVSSLFNSHLSDFTQGWTYVFGVGILGGLVLRSSRSPPGLAPVSPP